MTEAEGVIRYESGYIKHSAKKDYGPLEFTGRTAQKQTARTEHVFCCGKKCHLNWKPG